MCPTFDDLQILGIASLIGMCCCYKMGQWKGVKRAEKEIEKVLPKISDIVVKQQTDLLNLEQLMKLKDHMMFKIFFTRSMN